jgi:4a-hydroxytetrahydrobiopterin dehydratase
VVGWRLLDEEGGLKLQCLWKLRDFKCGVELINRIHEVAEAAGHYPNLHLEQPNQVRAEIWTASIGKPLN